MIHLPSADAHVPVTLDALNRNDLKAGGNNFPPMHTSPGTPDALNPVRENFPHRVLQAK